MEEVIRNSRSFYALSVRTNTILSIEKHTQHKENIMVYIVIVLWIIISFIYSIFSTDFYISETIISRRLMLTLPTLLTILILRSMVRLVKAHSINK